MQLSNWRPSRYDYLVSLRLAASAWLNLPGGVDPELDRHCRRIVELIVEEGLGVVDG